MHDDPAAFRRRLFSARTTLAVRLALLGLFLGGAAALFATLEYHHSDYWTGIGIARDQPVLFSHRHHAGELRIDCRFCHATVETSAGAGLPSTQVCLTCHSQIFHDTPLLRPVVASADSNTPLLWTRVTSVPDHVHFDHSIHIAKGIACASCHGEVTDMPLVAKAHPLTMRECIACHRDPAANQVPAAAVFSSPGAAPGRTVRPAAITPAAPLTSCSTCHR